MLSIAIVGTGWWGMELGKAAKAVPDRVELVGCFAPSEKECAVFKAAYGGRIFASYEEILADAKVQAVVLATPHSTHWQQIVQAAQAGKHVFCEKPFTLSVETGRKAMEACEKAGVVLAVGHNRRYLPGARRMKAIIDAGELGKVLHVEASYAGNGAFSRPATHWRSRREEMPCGGLAPMALHVVDTFTWMLGPVAKLACLSKRQVSPVDIDDTCASLFEMESGATGFLSSLMAGPMASHLRICGSKATLEARSNWSELTLTPLDAKQPVTRLSFSGDDTLQQELAALDDAVAGKAPYPVKPAEALRNVAVMETMLKSSLAGGAWMQVRS
jgi:predicted dehydrogenase